MANILWFSWCGGGNLPPSLGIARVLSERGHNVSFAGRPEMLPRVRAAGFSAIELTDAYRQIDAYPADSPVRGMICYLTSPAVAVQVHAVAKNEAPDIVLVDAKFVAALSVAPHFGCRSVVICHTFFYRMLQSWQEHIVKLNELRQEAGFSSLPDLDRLWLAREGIVVTTLPEFDPPSNVEHDVAYHELVSHVGPVLDDEILTSSLELPWPSGDQTPIILLSFSTQPEQRALDRFQETLDALAAMPVHVVATTAGIIRPEELRVPDNAVILAYAAHDPLMQLAALVITHGGHGTAMRSLRHGLPMVFMPGIAPDQPTVAATCQEWGVGRIVPDAGSLDTIRNIVQDVMFDPSYRQQAAFRGLALGNSNGAIRAANKIETLV